MFLKTIDDKAKFKFKILSRIYWKLWFGRERIALKSIMEAEMTKKAIGAGSYLYPMPTVLIGTLVHGKPNFITIGYCGIVNHEPPVFTFGSDKNHYSNLGIKQNGCFSVNLPSVKLLAQTDFCGTVSGRETDKSRLFKIFYGKLERAPMIDECPLTMECKLIKVDETIGSHEIFLGEIVETYVENECLNNGIPDIAKLDPVLFSMYDWRYWKVGDNVGHVGHESKKVK